MAQSLYIPTPSTWSSLEEIKAPQLRADVSGTIQLLSRPPMFIGIQQLTADFLTAQTLPSGSDTTVQFNVNQYDSQSGHFPGGSTAEQETYYGQLPGWYLCQCSVPLNYTGGAGALTAGIAGVQNGVGPDTFYGMRIPNPSGTQGVVFGAKLMQIVTTGAVGGSGDYFQCMANQNSGSTQALLLASFRVPLLTCRWVCANSGSVVTALPTNDTWPPPSTTLTAAAAIGVTSISVASTTGMTYYGGAGGVLGLDIGTPVAENVTMTGPPSGSVVPVTATKYAHLNGAAVAVPVSAAFLNKNVRDAAQFLLYPPIMEAQHQASQTLASQTSVPAVGTAITLGTPAVDNFSALSGSTWAAPVSSTYYAYGQVSLSCNTTTQTLAAGLTVTSANYNSGSTVTLWGGAQDAYNSSGGVVSSVIVQRKLRLNAGDTVALAGFQHDTAGSGASVLTSGEWISRLLLVWESA